MCWRGSKGVVRDRRLKSFIDRLNAFLKPTLLRPVSNTLGIHKANDFFDCPDMIRHSQLPS